MNPYEVKDTADRRYKESHCIVAGLVYFCAECDDKNCNYRDLSKRWRKRNDSHS